MLTREKWFIQLKNDKLRLILQDFSCDSRTGMFVKPMTYCIVCFKNGWANAELRVNDNFKDINELNENVMYDLLEDYKIGRNLVEKIGVANETL